MKKMIENWSVFIFDYIILILNFFQLNAACLHLQVEEWCC